MRHDNKVANVHLILHIAEMYSVVFTNYVKNYCLQQVY